MSCVWFVNIQFSFCGLAGTCVYLWDKRVVLLLKRKTSSRDINIRDQPNTRFSISNFETKNLCLNQQRCPLVEGKGTPFPRR